MNFFKKPINYLKQTPSFLREVKIQLQKVDWPSREETIKYTAIVIGVTLSIAIFLGGLDFLFNFLVKKFII